MSRPASAKSQVCSVMRAVEAGSSLRVLADDFSREARAAEAAGDFDEAMRWELAAMAVVRACADVTQALAPTEATDVAARKA